jgi:DNA-binding NtrC family response regulator
VKKNNILIIDETGFARVCRSVLALEGFAVDALGGAAAEGGDLDLNGYDLVITSFPYGQRFFDHIRQAASAAIILSDSLSGDLVKELRGFAAVNCLVKPIDFGRLTELVGEAVAGNLSGGGFSIV